MSIHVVATHEEMILLGRRIGGKLSPGRVVAVTGTLGAGKTTLTKGIAQSLDIQEEVTSPTYTVISEYIGRWKLYHMDLYRIGSAEEFEMMGAEELLYDSGVAVIEWSEKAESLLPENTIHIDIQLTERGKRKVTISGIEL